jgi:hypothetical protein
LASEEGELVQERLPLRIIINQWNLSWNGGYSNQFDGKQGFFKEKYMFEREIEGPSSPGSSARSFFSLTGEPELPFPVDFSNTSSPMTENERDRNEN